MKHYRWIVWDWNGTLLDDVDTAIRCVNDMLAKRRRTDRMDRKRYHALMEMPIIRFYEKLFDLKRDPFSQLSVEFVESYQRYVGDAALMEGALDTLQALKSAGFLQAILSSFEAGQLKRYVARFGIGKYFQAISGADNIRSESKERRGAELAEQLSIFQGEAVMIGDLAHDYESALAMGADCILIANGHQNLINLERETAQLTSSGGNSLLRFVSDIRQVPVQLQSMAEQRQTAFR